MNTFILIVLGQIVSLFGNAALRFACLLYTSPSPRDA
mgnify:CR=1 FL=1